MTWAAVSNATVRYEAATVLKNVSLLHHQQMPGRLNLKQIGLVRSHATIYQKLLGSKSRYALIAEDDLRLCPTFAESYAAVLLQLPHEFDWIKLEQCNPPMRHCPSSSVVRPGHHACTALYIVSRAGAAWLLKANPPHRPGWASGGAMDWVHFKDTGMRPPRAFSANPPLGWQDKSV